MIKVEEKPYKNRTKIDNFTSSRGNGLHSALRYTLMSCKCMGLLPLSGLTSASSLDLRVTKRFYLLIYVTSVCGQTFMSLSTWYRQFKNGIDMTNFRHTFFHTSGLLSTIILLRFFIYWPNLVKKVEEIEKGNIASLGNVNFKINRTIAFVFVLALVEYMLSVIHAMKLSVLCDPDNVAENYFTSYMPWIFDYTSFHLWKGIVGMIFSIQSTFLWTYNDLHIMVFSIYLTEHFNVHNKILKENSTKTKFQWHQLRTKYWSSVKVFKLIEKQIGTYVFMSFSANFYWICTQLFNTLSEDDDNGHFVSCTSRNSTGVVVVKQLEHTFYFAYSSLFLIIRALLVSILAGGIHSAALKPLTYLYNVPAMNFNIEVQRYIEQIKYSNIALNGLDFFYVTRQMALTLAGYVVTYELVLLQFNPTTGTSPKTNETCSAVCNYTEHLVDGLMNVNNSHLNKF